MDLPVTLIAQAAPPKLPDDLAPAVTIAPADGAATARFSELMQVPPSPVAEAVQQAYPAIPPVGAEGRTMGDSILTGLQNLSSEFQQSWQTVNNVLQSNERLTIPDLLKLQMGLVQLSIQHEMVGKTISRSTQNLDQLIKLQ
jgi:type III secretion protein I